MKHIYNDGGRKDAGYQGDTGDCVVRAIAIATGERYEDVYNTLFDMIRNHKVKISDRIKERIYGTKRVNATSPRNGVPREIFGKYLEDMGWKWIPTLKMVNYKPTYPIKLTSKNLPMGRLLVIINSHLTTVIDRVLHDTYDWSKSNDTAVRGYYQQL